MIVSFFVKSDNGHAIVSQEKRWLPKSTARFPAKAEDSSLLSRWIALELSPPPPPPMQSVRADGRTLTSKSKFLSDLLTHGAPMAHFARWSPL